MLLEDEKIISLFFDRSEQAIIELDKKYGTYCRRLSFNLLNNWQDAEECINDAYLGIWHSIPPTRPKRLLTYLCKIVRNISLKRYHRNTACKRNSHYDVALEELEACLASHYSVEYFLNASELALELERFLDTLHAENRVIFLRRYWFSEPYKEIAKRVGLTEKNVSVRLTRIRRQLKE